MFQRVSTQQQAVGWPTEEPSNEIVAHFDKEIANYKSLLQVANEEKISLVQKCHLYETQVSGLCEQLEKMESKLAIREGEGDDPQAASNERIITSRVNEAVGNAAKQYGQQPASGCAIDEGEVIGHWTAKPKVVSTGEGLYEAGEGEPTPEGKAHKNHFVAKWSSSGWNGTLEVQF